MAQHFFMENNPWILLFQQLRPIFDQIRQFYFGENVIDETQILPYERLFSDIGFSFSTQHAAVLHAAKTNAPIRVLL